MPVTTSTTVLGALGLAVLAVFVQPLWQWTQTLDALVHEAGHATGLLVFGNWPRGIQLHAGGGGSTGLPRRALFWPGAFVGGIAGYTAPSVAGLVLARGVDRGWSPAAVLAVLMVVLVAVVLFHENWFGLVVMVVTGLLLALFLWRAGATAQLGAVIALAWFLLLSAVRSLWDLLGGSPSKVVDFAYLARLTSIPAGFWFLVIGVIDVAALVAGARWLLY
jgi:hypothetical protein